MYSIFIECMLCSIWSVIEFNMIFSMNISTLIQIFFNDKYMYDTRVSSWTGLWYIAGACSRASWREHWSTWSLSISWIVAPIYKRSKLIHRADWEHAMLSCHRSGWGLLSQFSSFLYFRNFYESISCLLNITFFFDRCHHSEAAVTPVK